MKKVLGWIFNRWTLGAVLLIALLCLVWWVGPAVSIGEARPLDTERSRWIVTLVLMVGLIALDAWWAVLIYVFLMLATGNMVLEAVALRHPHSALGAWWLRQKSAAGRRVG